jgi:hypothetical protein
LIGYPENNVSAQKPQNLVDGNIRKTSEYLLHEVLHVRQSKIMKQYYIKWGLEPWLTLSPGVLRNGLG